MARHRSCDEPLHQLAASRVDDCEAHAPDRAAHEIHSEQPGNQKVDVAGARLAHQLILCDDGILASGALLHGRIGAHTRIAPFGIGVVVVVNDRPVCRALDEQRDSAFTQRAKAVFYGRKRVHCERRGVFERRGVAADLADAEHFRRRVAERKAETGCEEQRKTEDPKQRFRLAEELAEAHERQLYEWMITHRADAVPSA
jgi:hypothetical protein